MKRILFFWLFFLSGFSALVYEVVWARQLVLVFGNTVYAVSTILTIFFAGLALGSLIFGRLVDKLASSGERLASSGERLASRRKLNTKPYTLNPLFIYALLELGIGIYAALTPWIFKLIESAQVGLAYRFEPSYSSFSLFTFVLSFLGLIFPTILMGGTLPVISRFLANSETKSGEVIGNLYGLNTLGGVLGVLLAGFFLIQYLGVRETIWLAAGVNLAIGVVVLVVGSKRRASSVERRAERIEARDVQELAAKRYPLYAILIVFTLTGFAALALEVLWTKVLILVFGSSTYAFTIILAVFLSGIALGSLLSSKFLLGRKNLAAWFVFGEIILGVLVFLVTLVLPQTPFLFLNFYKSSYHFANTLWASLLISFLVILPLTTLMGILFPIGLKILVSDFKRLGRDLGKVYSLNTLGGILGSFSAGFILIPYLGLQKGILSSGLLYLLSGVLILMILPFGRKLKILTALAVIFLAISSFFFPTWDKDILSSGVFVYFQEYFEAKDAKAAMKKGQLLFYKEGLSATVTVKKEGRDLHLRINGKTDASTGIDDFPTELLVGHLPLLFHPNPQKVLVIGLGSGITLGAVEQHPIEKVDMVEIEPVIIEAARYFNKENHQALEDKRLKIIVGDGRNFLFTTKNKYDVISSEPSNPWVKGNANLFTQEYYELAKRHLEEGGMFLQWVQNYYLDKESLKTAIATFRSVFPNMSLWSLLSSNDLLLLGTKEPLSLDYDVLEKKFQNEKIRKDLERVSINKAADILGLYLFDGEGVKRLVGEVKLHSDNHPILEFSAPFSLGRTTIGENLETLLSVRVEPYSFINNLTLQEKKKIEANLDLKENVLRGKIVLTKGNLKEALSYFSKALAIDPAHGQVKKEAAEVYFYQAEIFYSQNNLPGAKEALLKVIELDPSRFKAHLNLGAVYFQEGNIPEAASQWAIAKELDPESEEIEKNLKLLEKYFPGE